MSKSAREISEGTSKNVRKRPGLFGDLAERPGTSKNARNNSGGMSKNVGKYPGMYGRVRGCRGMPAKILRGCRKTSKNVRMCPVIPEHFSDVLRHSLRIFADVVPPQDIPRRPRDFPDILRQFSTAPSESSPAFLEIPGHFCAFPDTPGHFRTCFDVPLVFSRAFFGIPRRTRAFLDIPARSRASSRTVPGIPGHSPAFFDIPRRSSTPPVISGHPRTYLPPVSGGRVFDPNSFCEWGQQYVRMDQTRFAKLVNYSSCPFFCCCLSFFVLLLSFKLSGRLVFANGPKETSEAARTPSANLTNCAGRLFFVVVVLILFRRCLFIFREKLVSPRGGAPDCVRR